MRKEIESLDAKGTWEVVQKSNIAPVNGKLPNIIPTTWAFKIKHFPDGHLHKFKSWICVRGDKMKKDKDFDESCGHPPLVGPPFR